MHMFSSKTPSKKYNAIANTSKPIHGDIMPCAVPLATELCYCCLIGVLSVLFTLW